MAIVMMTTLECGPNGSFAEGSSREVTFEQGEMLVNTRHATWVDKGVSEAAALVGDEEANLAPHDAEEKRKAADAAKPKQPARR